MRRYRWVSGFSLLAVLCGCNGGSGADPGAAPAASSTSADPGSPYLGTTISSSQQQVITQDFEFFSGLALDPSDSTLTGMTRTADSSAASLIRWFNTRVRYMSFGGGIRFRLNLDGGGTDEYFFAMSSNGAQYLHDLYPILPFLKGQNSRTQSFGVIVDSDHVVPVTPDENLGVVNLGDQFFREQDPQHPGSVVDRIFRLSILFHEARHADGKEFNHVMCPSTSTFPGTINCDSRPDGAYELQVELMNKMMNAVPNLTDSERAALQPLLRDFGGRLVN